MPVHLYALLTWTTLRRLPLIHAGAGSFLRRMLPEIARRHGTRLIELGIVRNHVHLVLELPSQVDIPRLVQGLKGASARLRPTVVECARLAGRDSLRAVAAGKTPGAGLGGIPGLRARARRKCAPCKGAPSAERAL